MSTNCLNLHLLFAFKNNIVGLLKEWKHGRAIISRSKSDDKGGTMRLGSYSCVLKKNSKASLIYKKKIVKERHRHRYEVNISYEKKHVIDIYTHIYVAEVGKWLEWEPDAFKIDNQVYPDEGLKV